MACVALPTCALAMAESERYLPLRIRLKQPDLSVEEQAAKHGSALWKRQPDQCCNA